MNASYGLVALVAFARLVAAQTPLNERVLVVYNEDSPESKQVASYYAAKRAIPAQNVCKIRASSFEGIKQDEFDARVKQPIRKCLEAVGKGKILYIVFAYQAPFLVEVGGQPYALDQFVADVWDEYVPERAANVSEIQPYFGIAQSEGDFYQDYLPLADYRNLPNARTIYSVWRLDAPNAALAKGLVDKALDAEAHGLTGNGCFDRARDPMSSVADFTYGSGDWDIHQAAELARRAGFNVIEDAHEQEFGTAPAPLRCDHAALYAGWYSLNHYNDAFSWNPGAIGIHLDSGSAMNPRAGTNWAANALAHGITVTSGAVSEPYLDNLPHPDQALWYLFHGANVGDALLRSERLLKWKILNIGDPLYRPFSKSAELAARMKPPVILALLPQNTLGGTTSAGAIGVDRSGSQGPVTFSLRSEQPALVSVPQTVTIPEGTEAVKFPITTHGATDDGTTVRLFATANHLSRSNTLVIFSPLAPLNITPDKVKGNSAATGMVALRRAAAEKVTITLASSDPSIASIPPEVEIPQGQQKATFRIETHAASAEKSVVISASYAQTVRKGTLTVIP